MDVALAHHHIDLAVDLDLGLLVRVEQDPVALLDRTRVRSDTDDLRPGQPAAAHGSRRRDDDAAGRAAFAGLLVEFDQDPVVAHVDGGLFTHRTPATLRTTKNNPPGPTPPTPTLRL